MRFYLKLCLQDKIEYIRIMMLASLNSPRSNFAGDFLAKGKDKLDRESSFYTGTSTRENDGNI